MAIFGLVAILLAALLVVVTHLLDKADKKSGSYLRASNQVDPSLDGEQQMLQFWKILSEDPEHAVRDRWIGVCMWGSVVSSMIGVALLCICYMPLP